MSGLTDLWCDGVRLDVTNVALADEAVLSQVSKHASRSGWRGVADCQSAIQQATSLRYEEGRVGSWVQGADGSGKSLPQEREEWLPRLGKISHLVVCGDSVWRSA